jgi:hypothetical protein
MTYFKPTTCKEVQIKLIRIDAYPMYNIPTIANTTTSRTRVASCEPIPTKAERRTKLRGGLKTSP